MHILFYIGFSFFIIIINTDIKHVQFIRRGFLIEIFILFLQHVLSACVKKLYETNRKDMTYVFCSLSLGLTRKAPSCGTFFNKSSAWDLVAWEWYHSFPSCFFGCGTGSFKIIKNSWNQKYTLRFASPILIDVKVCFLITTYYFFSAK